MFSPAQSNGTNRLTPDKAVFTGNFLLMSIVVTIVFLIIYLVNSEEILAIQGTIFLISYTICYFLLKKGKINLSRILFTVIINVNVFMASQIAGPQGGEMFFFFPLATGALILFDTEEWKSRLTFTVLPILLLSLSDFIVISWIPRDHMSETELMLNRKFCSISSAIATLLCVYYFLKQHRKSLKMLKEQTLSLSSLIEKFNESIWQIDANYILINHNNTFSRSIKKQFGIEIKNGEYLFKNSEIFDQKFEGYSQRWKEYYDRALKGERFSIEETHQSGGKNSYKEINMTPVLQDAVVVGIIIHAKNITSRKIQEWKLNESLEQNRTLALVASTTQHAVIISNSNGDIEWTNTGFELMTGYELHQVINKNTNELLHGPLTTTESKILFEQQIKSGKSFTHEQINYRKNGEPFWSHITVSILYDNERNISKIIRIDMDITERKQSEDQLQMLLLHSQKLNKQLQVRDKELQTSIRKLNKQSWELQISEEALHKQKTELEKMNAELSSKALQLGHQNEFIIEKNTELEKAKAALAHKAEQLELSSRYKSEFMANMSHELRTPLNSIIILSKLLADNKNELLGTKELEFARVVHKSGSDLLNLINDILDLSKIEAGKIELESEEISITEIANDHKNLFHQLASEKGIEYRILNNTKSNQKIISDQQRLSQVIKNLLTNAFKFTAKGGTVELEFSNTNDNTISISIKDNGIGIPYDKHQLIFESFKQVDGSISRKYGGTGLGLSICKELITLLGGKITVNSEAGKGSTFTIIIPVNNLQKENSRQQLSKPANTESNPKLLIIEDDSIYADMLQKFAFHEGFEAEVCLRGDTGLMRAKEVQPDAILLDINLPGMDGYRILTKLEEDTITCNIPVYVISSSKNIHGKLNDSVVAWLEKPVSRDQLKDIYYDIRQKKQIHSGIALLVEDSREESLMIKSILKKQNIHCEIVSTNEEAIIKSKENIFDCIILDINLPDSKGFLLLKKLKENKSFTNVPVIVFSGRDLNDVDKSIISEYASTYIHKSNSGNDSLLDETQVFLSSVKEQKLRKPVNHFQNTNGHLLKGRKILIVDDDQRNIYAISSMLEEYDIKLFIAGNGNEALEKLAAHPDIEMVLMDVMMPVMDGYEATKAIRKQAEFSNLPVIALTAKAMKGDRELSLEAGMNDHISKPVQGNQLIQIMNSYFE